MRNGRAGLTLIEALVVIFVLGLLVALLIPAVQVVRESARRTSCQNNLHQMGLALQSHASAHRALPSLYNGSFLSQPRARDEFHFHSWRSAILLELEQTAILSGLDLKVPATDAINQVAVNSMIPTFLCPSTPNGSVLVRDIYGIDVRNVPGNIVGTAARSDYEAIGGVKFPGPGGTFDLSSVKFGAWGEPRYDSTRGISTGYRRARHSDIIDGVSNTMLVGERSGRPDLFRRGQPVDPYPYRDPGRGMDHHQAAWGISTHFWWMVFWHEQKVNETNATGIFGFHRGGANVAIADGSVRFLSDTTDSALLTALATRAGSENVNLP